MRYQALSIYSLGLAICGISLLLPSKSPAEPAPVFRPLLNDIRTQLPKGMVIRLPSSLPDRAKNVQLYPYIESQSDRLSIMLAVTPDCPKSDNPPSCTVGGLGVVPPSGVKHWPPQKEENLTSVNLIDGIPGFYFTRNRGSSRYVLLPKIMVSDRTRTVRSLFNVNCELNWY